MNNNKRVDTNLIIYQHSNNSTCVHQESQVNKIFFLKTGQFITNGATTSGGELGLGKNVLVAYMPWEGYNFKDAILIRVSIIYEDTHLFILKSMKLRLAQRVGVLKKRESNILRHLDNNGLIL
jgi:DNA-directed RNA polymerase subunit beta